MLIREIKENDNQAIAKIIRDVFDELNAPKEGTAYADPILDTLYQVYQNPKSKYFVVEKNGKVLGGCGVGPLEKALHTTCELQKMYFAPEIRGLGLAEKIIIQCLDFATTQGFTQCYLETLPFMKAAQKVYAKIGFTYLNAPMGGTGHTSCDVWMLKTL